MPIIQTRRRFMSSAALAGAAALLQVPRMAAAEGALETTTVRVVKVPGAICLAPQNLSEQLLRAEGFTDVSYVDGGPTGEYAAQVGKGEADFALEFAAKIIQAIDNGAAVTVLGGAHVGCYELFAKDEVRSIAELKGRTVGVAIAGANPHAFLIAMAAHVGLDPRQDIRWVTSTDPSVKPLELFAEGKIDAFLGTPPEPQELRARHVGHVIFNSTVDRPWSEYFCCMLVGNGNYVRKYPNATKRVLRAILKGADLCASEPARVAQRLVDRGFTDRYDYSLDALSSIPYSAWREYDPEDTVRYYALRLHEAGFIKSNPNKIIADNTEWRFLNELKRELKA
jgi:NitT/TauT family transport system substrate-binding protein